MKQSRFIKKCGPYRVQSISQDNQGVRLLIYPAFPQYNEKGEYESRWVVHRLRGDGGGPSIFTAMELAKEFEKFLNQLYTEAQVQEWKATLEEAGITKG